MGRLKTVLNKQQSQIALCSPPFPDLIIRMGYVTAAWGRPFLFNSNNEAPEFERPCVTGTTGVNTRHFSENCCSISVLQP